MPDIVFNTRDELPEELREFAKDAEGGKVIVNLVANEKLKEFRDNNVKVVKERDDLAKELAPFKKIFPEFDENKVVGELNELRTIAKRVKDGDLKESKAVEEALAERTKEMRKGLEDQLSERGKALKAAQDKALAAEQRVKEQAVKIAVRDAISNPNSGVVQSAVQDIIQRAMTVFVVEDDEKVIPKQGGAVLYGQDGVTAMSPLEWLGTLKEQSPHLFKQSNGGGGNVGEKKFGGFSAEDVSKMTPEQKLALANEQNKPKGY